MICRGDTETDDAFLTVCGSQYNSLVDVLFCRTTPPLYDQVLFCFCRMAEKVESFDFILNCYAESSSYFIIYNVTGNSLMPLM